MKMKLSREICINAIFHGLLYFPKYNACSCENLNTLLTYVINGVRLKAYSLQ